MIKNSNHVDELVSFFNSSSVTSFNKKFDKKIKNEDTLIVEYDGRTYIRLMKHFDPWKDGTEKLKIEFLSKNLIEKLYNPFYLRFYLPKKTIRTIGKKIDKIIVLINGMNELDHLHLYDKIGEYFAENNIAVVLLSTPLHLFRRIDDTTYPTTFANKYNNELLFLYSYLISFKELSILVSYLQGSGDDENNPRDFGFYSNYFDPKVKVTLMGYSLGGIKALSYFMNLFEGYERYWENKSRSTKNKVTPSDLDEYFKGRGPYCSCVTLNSVPNLYSVEMSAGLAKTITPKAWRKLMEKFKTSFSNKREIIIKNNIKYKKLIDTFKLLYFPIPENKESIEAQKVQEEINNIIDNYLAVSGGDDDIAQHPRIQKFTSHSVHQIIVAKGDHFMGKDKSEWYEVFPRIQNSLLDFLNENYERHYNGSVLKENIIELIMMGVHDYKTIIEQYKGEVTTACLKKIIDSFATEKDRRLFREYYFKSKIFFPDFNEIFRQIK